MHQSIKEPAAPQRDPSASRNGFEMTSPPPGRYAPHPRQTNDRNSANCRTEGRVPPTPHPPPPQDKQNPPPPQTAHTQPPPPPPPAPRRSRRRNGLASP